MVTDKRREANFIQNTVYISLTVGYVRESTLLKLAKEYLDVLIHLLIESAVLSCPIRSLKKKKRKKKIKSLFYTIFAS